MGMKPYIAYQIIYGYRNVVDRKDWGELRRDKVVVLDHVVFTAGDNQNSYSAPHAIFYNLKTRNIGADQIYNFEFGGFLND